MMIKINLLPENLRKEESSFSKISLSLKGKTKTFRNIVIVVALALVVTHSVLFVTGTKSSKIFAAMTHKYNTLAPGRKEYTALKTEVVITTKKAASIDTLMANRFSWAEKLNSLSDSMTQGIWLTSLSYSEKPGELSVQAPAAPARGAAKKEITKTETRRANLRYLNISGYASSMGEQGTSLIGKFIQSMKDNPAFFRDFSEIKLESIKSDKVLDQEVMNFKITCLFK